MGFPGRFTGYVKTLWSGRIGSPDPSGLVSVRTHADRSDRTRESLKTSLPSNNPGGFYGTSVALS